MNHWFPASSISSTAPVGATLPESHSFAVDPGVGPGHPLCAVLVPRQLPELAKLGSRFDLGRAARGECIVPAHGTRIQADQALAERPQAQEEGTREAARGGSGRRAREVEAGLDVSLVTAVHLYVTDLDRSIDWYTRLLGRGPAAAYDEGENAHSAFFVLEGQTFLVLTWDPERGREIGGVDPARARAATTSRPRSPGSSARESRAAA